jgi:hypothetical protein
MKDTMKLSLPPRLVEKLVWFPLFCFLKFSFPVARLMPHYVETGFLRPNRESLWIVLL